MTHQQNRFRSQFPYPRRRVIRYLMQRLTHLGFCLLTKLQISGEENLPSSGPLIVVANHFHFADTAAIIRAIPWPLDFLGGTQLVDAPPGLVWIPKLWGYYAVRRGSASRTALRAAKAVLAQNGVLAIFPEGGSWAPVLRPARPGTAYLAAETGSRLLPIGLDGVTELFPTLERGKRATVTIRIGPPFGPFQTKGRGHTRRQQLEKIGHEIMQHIAALLPPERRGVYASDPAIRAAAEAVAAYPYDDLN
ncbi:MAG: lysophospholipid acyltransferase family protein [Anaerolineae bacterium]|jgi:1-acyl-sn-glycerol-3-phosphate acyltransferase